MERFLVIIIIAVMSGSCAKFHAEPLSTEQTSASYLSRTLDDPGLQKYIQDSLHKETVPWPPQSWDFTLLTLAAFYYSPDLELARAQWAEALAGEITAAELPNPTLDLVINLEVMLSIPVETAGKRGYRKEQAKHLSEAARWNIEAEAWRVRSHVRRSLLDLYSDQQQKLLLDDQMKLNEQMVGLLQNRLRAGEVAQFELGRAQIERDQARKLLSELETRTATDRATLAAALGVPAPALAGIEFNFDLFELPPPELDLNQLKDKALQNRPDILQALAEYEAAQSALQLEIAKQYPDLSIGPGYEWGKGVNEWRVGISMTLPVFNQNQGGIAQAKARRTKAAGRFIALQAAVIAELDRSLAEYQGTLRELESADSVLISQDKQRRSAEAMFNAGETDRIDLLDAQMRYLSARASRLTAALNAQTALGYVEDAAQYSLIPAGGPFGDLSQNPRPKEGTQT
jgi:outer membrane protein TolC